MFVCVQIRKQQKDHAELIEDYRSKQQQHRPLQQQQTPAATPPMLQAGAPPLPQPMSPMHPGGPTPACIPNIPPGWTGGAGAPAVMGQRMPRQMPPTLPNAPQASPHNQTPQVMVPNLTPTTPGFNSSTSGGPNGAAGDGGNPAPQVTHSESIVIDVSSE